MAIAADLLDYPLSEILFFLASRNASGHLTVRHADLEVFCVLNQGQVVAIESTDRRQRLGQRLVAAETITPEQLTRAIDYLANHPGALTIGSALVELGFLSTREIQAALRAQWTEQLFQILIHNHEGRFTFEPAATSLRGINADIEAQGLVLEAIRRADEWLDQQLRVQPLYIAQRTEREHVELTAQEDIQVLHLLDLNPMTLGDLSIWLGLSWEQVLESLHRLYARKLIVLTPSSPQREESQQPIIGAKHEAGHWHATKAIPVIRGIREAMVAL